ncbi:MAG: hypothetical protein IPK97_14130 [Ahniella sp.]|nr:hypothetical protein [Ahniella sp.]
MLAVGGGQTASGAGPKPGDIPVLSLWDLESGQRLPQPEFIDDYTATLPPLVYWRPDGQQLVTSWPKATGLYDGGNGPYWAGIERFVRISDSATGKESFAVNHGPADSVAWRPDGKRMAVCHQQRVQIYTCDAHELMALARTRISRNFTFDECVQYFNRGNPPPIP